MDLLLDPLPPRPAISRPSMELQELLEQQPLRAPPNLHGLHMPRHSLDSNSSRDGGRSAASRCGAFPATGWLGLSDSWWGQQQRANLNGRSSVMGCMKC